MRIVAIEGPDGVGKTTLIESLLTFFKLLGVSVAYRHFPRYNTDLGKFIKSVLIGKSKIDLKWFQLLYSADRLDFSSNEYKQLKNQFDILLVDRYILSGVVYGMMCGLPLDYIWQIEEQVVRPDLNIILQVNNVDVLLDRMKNRLTRNVYETRQHLQQVIQYYDLMGAIFSDVFYVDAERSPQQIITDTIHIITDELDLDISKNFYM